MTTRRPSARSRGRPPHADVLTPAEWRVVEAVRHGLSNPQIARRQGVSLDAVKYHVANALQKLGLAARADLRRWDGVRGDSPLKRRKPDMTAPPKLGALAQIARTVPDIDAAKVWYGEVLGLDLIYAFPGMAFFHMGDVRLYLQQGEKPGPESVLYFRVDDIHAAHAELTGRGVAFVNAPHMIYRDPAGAETWLAEFRDPEGRPLALMAQTPAMAEA
jgi:DNA-binding CsgD family transcriptional regulator/catechol 2,3-dioxygenase-like lactoylglutathione lyase family enzyme